MLSDRIGLLGPFGRWPFRGPLSLFPGYASVILGTGGLVGSSCRGGGLRRFFLDILGSAGSIVLDFFSIDLARGLAGDRVRDVT